MGPGDLKEHVVLQNSTQPLRSTGEGLLWVPPVLDAILVGTREMGLLHGGPPALELPPWGGLLGLYFYHKDLPFKVGFLILHVECL